MKTSNKPITQLFLSFDEVKREEYLKILSYDEIKDLFLDLNKDMREKAFNLLNPESQTQFMLSMLFDE